MRRTTVDNRYAISGPLGSGGMAEVFLARDEELGRDVALKVLRGAYAADAESAERFRREALSAASLSHPNIVSVFDRGEAPDGTSYIAMEYVPGGTLKQRIERRGPLDPRQALLVAGQIAEALEAAHASGVIHRDIKPQNVLVTASGNVKVTDFGIARAASAASISRTNAVMGTAGYLSPEQALGRPVDARSDLYSLGVVLYEMLTGEPPFASDNPMAVCMKHVNEAPRPPRERDPQIPPQTEALVMRLLSKNREDRPQSATELLEDLDLVLDDLQPGHRRADATTVVATGADEPATPPRPVTESSQVAAVRRHRKRRISRGLAIAAVAALALLGVALLGLSQDPSGQDPPRAADTPGAPTNPSQDASDAVPPSAVPPASSRPGGETDPSGSQYGV